MLVTSIRIQFKSNVDIVFATPRAPATQIKVAKPPAINSARELLESFHEKLLEARKSGACPSSKQIECMNLHECISMNVSMIETRNKRVGGIYLRFFVFYQCSAYMSCPAERFILSSFLERSNPIACQPEPKSVVCPTISFVRGHAAQRSRIQDYWLARLFFILLLGTRNKFKSNCTQVVEVEATCCGEFEYEVTRPSNVAKVWIR